MLELGVEGLGLAVVDEVAALDAPPGDGVDHPVGDLLERVLALGGAEGAPEVLLGDDVGGVERPVDGELDVDLLEGDGAVLVVGDAGVTPLPGHLVVGVDARGREVPADADAGLLRGQCHGCSCGDANGWASSPVHAQWNRCHELRDSVSGTPRSGGSVRPPTVWAPTSCGIRAK